MKAEPIAKTPWLTYRNGRWGTERMDWFAKWTLDTLCPPAAWARKNGRKVRVLIFQRPAPLRRHVGFFRSRDEHWCDWVSNYTCGCLTPAMERLAEKFCGTGSYYARYVDIEVK